MRIEVRITDDEFHAVVSNALTGIWHWGAINQYGTKAYRIKEKDDAGRPRFHLSRGRMQRGLALALLESPVLAQQVAEYGIDAIDYPRADLVVQYALFGEVRYA